MTPTRRSGTVRRTVRSVAKRFDDGAAYLVEFQDEVEIRCPRCGARTTVLREGHRGPGRVACGQCAFTARSDVDGWLGPQRGHVRKRCPRCGSWVEQSVKQGGHDPAHLVCTCGWAFYEAVQWSPIASGPVDPSLGLALWLQAPFKGELLWAYNAAHLQFVRNFVAADIRTREPNKNSSLASRLPPWMKSAGNRDRLLALLGKMERTLVR